MFTLASYKVRKFHFYFHLRLRKIHFHFLESFHFHFHLRVRERHRCLPGIVQPVLEAMHQVRTDKPDLVS